MEDCGDLIVALVRKNNDAPRSISAPVPASSVQLAVAKALAENPGITRDDIFGKWRFKEIVRARRMAIQELHHTYRWHPRRIAQVFNMDVTSVLHHLGRRKSSKVPYKLAA